MNNNLCPQRLRKNRRSELNFGETNLQVFEQLETIVFKTVFANISVHFQTYLFWEFSVNRHIKTDKPEEENR